MTVLSKGTIVCGVCGILLLVLALPQLAPASDKVIFNKKYDTVRLVKTKDSVTGGVALDQPKVIGAEKIHNMLATLRFDKRNVLFKNQEDARLFDKRGLKMLSEPISQAFAAATPEQLVFFQFIKKAPYAKVIRNDRLIRGYLFVHDGKVFIRFQKLYAKIFGDYQRAGQQRMLNDAKDVRVSLNQQLGQEVLGQKLVSLQVSHDFYADLQREAEEKKQAELEKKKQEDTIGVPVPDAPPPSPKSKSNSEGSVTKLVKNDTAASAANPNSVEARLNKLDDLKEKKLISNQEYKAKRKEILDSI